MYPLGQDIEDIASGERRIRVCLGDEDIFVAKMSGHSCGTFMTRTTSVSMNEHLVLEDFGLPSRLPGRWT